MGINNFFIRGTVSSTVSRYQKIEPSSVGLLVLESWRRKRQNWAENVENAPHLLSCFSIDNPGLGQKGISNLERFFQEKDGKKGLNDQTSTVMKKKEDLAVVLSELLKINNDRIGIYRKAVKEINEHDLKVVFQRAIEESRKIESVLALEIFKRNSLPDVDATTTGGKIYRLWLEIKEFFTGKNYNSIVEACEFLEYCVQKAYKQALQHEDVSLELSQILNDQTMALRKSHKGLKTYPVIKTLETFRLKGTTMAEA